MKFQIMRAHGEWAITPCTGPLEGLVVARAEGVDMGAAHVVARSFVGTIKALWGATLSDVDDETLAALGLGRIFNMDADTPLHVDYDGVYDASFGAVKFVQKLVVFGEKITAKGIKHG